MKSEAARIPGYWRFLWMFFMQPTTLKHTLKTSGIDTEARGLTLWRARGAGRLLLGRMFLILTTIAVVGTLGLLFLLDSSGWVIDPVKVSYRLSLGVGLGVAVGLIASPFRGMALGIGVGVMLGASGVSPKLSVNLMEQIAWGLCRGLGWGVAGSLFFEVSPRATKGNAETGGRPLAAFHIATMVFIVLESVGTFGVGGLAGLTMGLTGYLAVLFTFFRLPIYSVEYLLQALLYWLEDFDEPWSILYSPICFHELSYFPNPLLAKHILRVAQHDEALAIRILEACTRSPGQIRAARKIFFSLQAEELKTLAQEGSFGRLVELEGTWLPGVRGADPLLLGFSETARYLASAPETSIPYHRLKKLKRAQERIKGLRNQLLQTKGPLARALLTSSLPWWESIITNELTSAQTEAANQLPNPFRAEEPLSPEQGREVFRGREDLIHTIESLLGEPGRGCSISLLGPRRTGKTSLLKMLPLFMPDAICIFFDLLDNPIDSPAAFFKALARRAREQAKHDRQLDLPELPDDSPFAAGSRWLESLDVLPENLRVLLCLDEFERLENLFPGSRRELLQLLGLLRATIQHRRRVRILVAGSAPFDEMDDVWNDNFINAREIRIGFLKRDAAVGLLRRPIDDFPGDAVPKRVAEAIFKRTGGQPNLVQLYGSLLVTRINRLNRRQAQPEDVARVEEDVLAQKTYYFRDLLQEALPTARSALIDLAHEQGPEMDAATRRWLRRRLLITEDGRLTMPVFGAWMRAEEGT